MSTFASFTPRFEVLVQVTRDVDEPSLGRHVERVLVQVSLGAKTARGVQTVSIREIRPIGDREKFGTGAEGAANWRGRDDLEREAAENGGGDGNDDQRDAQPGHRRRFPGRVIFCPFA